MTNEQEKLVTLNMGYAITLARQYKSEILSTDDLISEGAIGLMKAAEKYDASRGKPLKQLHIAQCAGGQECLAGGRYRRRNHANGRPTEVSERTQRTRTARH